jgi:hypothetical protein
MCLQCKRKIKNTIVVFMKDDINIGNPLEMHSSAKNKGPPKVVVYKFSKSYPCDDGEQLEEQMGDHLATNKRAIRILTKYDSRLNRFGKDGGYRKKERGLPKK